MMGGVQNEHRYRDANARRRSCAHPRPLRHRGETRGNFHWPPFTPDGHLVGSLGEALANYYCGIELCKASTERHDGLREGRRVEVKATQGHRIALSSSPEHLLVFRLHPDGSFEECFNGPGRLAWALVAHRKRPKNGQHQVSLAALMWVMIEAVSLEQILEPVRGMPSGMSRTRPVAH